METLILAQSTGASGISVVDGLVALVIQIAGAVIGLGFVVDAVKESFGKGASNEKGKGVAQALGWFIASVVMFAGVPKFLGIGIDFLGYL